VSLADYQLRQHHKKLCLCQFETFYCKKWAKILTAIQIYRHKFMPFLIPMNAQLESQSSFIACQFNLLTWQRQVRIHSGAHTHIRTGADSTRIINLPMLRCRRERERERCFLPTICSRFSVDLVQRLEHNLFSGVASRQVYAICFNAARTHDALSRPII
jgi:hypothetical protein